MAVAGHRYGEKTVCMALGIDVLACDCSLGIQAPSNGGDGVRIIDRDRRRSICELQEPVLFARGVFVSADEFPFRINVPKDCEGAVWYIVGLKHSVLQDISVLMGSNHVD